MKITRNEIIAIIIVLIVAAFVVMHKKSPVVTEPVTTISYSCDSGKSIVAIYGEKSAAITLSDGRAMTLKQTVSASGVRYANPDESFIFWSKGNGALVLENNKEKSYIGCIMIAPEPAGASLPQIYSKGSEGFSIRLPADYKANESYTYKLLGPRQDVLGVKFTIASSMATGTNLSNDSYISVEEIPDVTSCAAERFIDQPSKSHTIIENGTTYSVASSTDAAAGNRYEETVYAISGTNPCIAIRYYIHYGVIGNYPKGKVKEFDMKALVSQFDAIRRTLVINP